MKISTNAASLIMGSNFKYSTSHSMDYETYRTKFFTDPKPVPRFNFTGEFGVSLNFEDYEAAVDYYSQVLGPPAYVEGEWTKGWQIGNGWLTLFKGKSGGPQNVEVTLVMESTIEAERLQAEFIKAGGKGDEPTDQRMYEPIRFCPVVDPFGMKLLIIAPLSEV
jgi:hypothetical protein